MKTDTDILDQVKQYAEEFMQRKYPDEAPYFHTAWNRFRRVLLEKEDNGLTITDARWELEGPSVRGLEGFPSSLGDSTIVAPRVLHAFHILFTRSERMERENEDVKREMVQLLSENKFSLEFSMEIVTFFLEKRNEP
ncbi:MAG: hypothetical protein HXS44_07500 [Theionarchaea archaeon]|nr:hypothetical protein [Theionarchaea archaeon]